MSDVSRSRILQEHAAILAKIPRDIPWDWTPDELWVDGQVVKARSMRPDGGHIELGFVMTAPTDNARCMGQLFNSIWQALELIRLGQADQLQSLGLSQ